MGHAALRAVTADTAFEARQIDVSGFTACVDLMTIGTGAATVLAMVKTGSEHPPTGNCRRCNLSGGGSLHSNFVTHSASGKPRSISLVPVGGVATGKQSRLELFTRRVLPADSFHLFNHKLVNIVAASNSLLSHREVRVLGG